MVKLSAANGFFFFCWGPFCYKAVANLQRFASTANFLLQIDVFLVT